MTNEPTPTPETDAEMFHRPPTVHPQYVPYEFARAMEIQRNAARAERDALRADIARLRDVLQRIVNNGGSATNVMLFDARTALAQ